MPPEACRCRVPMVLWSLSLSLARQGNKLKEYCRIMSRFIALFAPLIVNTLSVIDVFAPQRNSRDKVIVGVDYYPEQWPLSQMVNDIRNIKQNLGADIIRVGEFMWSSIEPADGVFNFTLLDAILDAAESEGLKVMLGTPTATFPAWMYSSHAEEIVQVGPDSSNGFAGTSPSFGGRRQYSFDSDLYRQYASRVVQQLASRYVNRSVIHSWQIDNELGHEGSDLDFSNMTQSHWRTWLKVKYEDDIDILNSEWGNIFWGVTYGSFEQISLPRFTIPGSPPNPNQSFRSNMSPGMLLDYRRFRADSISSFAKEHVDIIREEQLKLLNTSGTTSNQLITTNSPGGIWGKAMNSNLFFNSIMDFVSYDNYPVWGGSLAPQVPSLVAMTLDMVRCWGQYDSGSFRGYTITEQLIGAQGHDIIGYTPRPNQAIAWSSQTFAHGGNALLFFRYRAAVFGQEEYCYGILDQTTPISTGRKWNEAKSVFSIARDYEKLWLAPVVSRVAVIYEMDNIYSWQAQPQSTAFDFTNEAHRLYQPFWRNGATIDVLSSERLVEVSLSSNYDVVLLPAPMMISDDLYKEIESFILEKGGSLWIGFRADIKVASNNQMRTDPSRLAVLAGVTVNEFESLNVGMESVPLKEPSTNNTASGSVWRDGLMISDEVADEVTAIWNYADSDFFGGIGLSAVTRRALDNGGEVVYVGTGIDPELLVPLATETLKRQGLHFAQTIIGPPSVEQLTRKDLLNNTWTISINHAAESVTFAGIEMLPFEVAVKQEITKAQNATVDSNNIGQPKTSGSSGQQHVLAKNIVLALLQLLVL